MPKVIGLALFVLLALPQSAHQNQAPPKSPQACPHKDGWTIPDEYYFRVIDGIHAPGETHTLLHIKVGGEIKLVLWTDGDKFSLSTNVLDIPAKNIGAFLLDLDHACKLPPDPRDALALINFRWEDKEMSAAQFAKFHDGLFSAAAQYISKARDRYPILLSERLISFPVDVWQYRIIYENSYEHIELDPYDISEDGKVDPIVLWVHDLKDFASASFHRDFPYPKRP